MDPSPRGQSTGHRSSRSRPHRGARSQTARCAVAPAPGRLHPSRFRPTRSGVYLRVPFVPGRPTDSSVLRLFVRGRVGRIRRTARDLARRRPTEKRKPSRCDKCAVPHGYFGARRVLLVATRGRTGMLRELWRGHRRPLPSPSRAGTCVRAFDCAPMGGAIYGNPLAAAGQRSGRVRASRAQETTRSPRPWRKWSPRPHCPLRPGPGRSADPDI